MRKGSRELDHAAFLVGRHADDPVTEVCPLCRVSRCGPWREGQAAVLAGWRTEQRDLSDRVGDMR
jgi:hypothetical protein